MNSEQKIEQLHRIIKSLAHRVLVLEWKTSGSNLDFKDWRDELERRGG